MESVPRSRLQFALLLPSGSGSDCSRPNLPHTHLSPISHKCSSLRLSSKPPRKPSDILSNSSHIQPSLNTKLYFVSSSLVCLLYKLCFAYFAYLLFKLTLFIYLFILLLTTIVVFNYFFILFLFFISS